MCALMMDQVENSISKIVAWTKAQQRVITGLAGGTLMLCSKQLTFTLLFAQSFREPSCLKQGPHMATGQCRPSG